MKWFEGTPGHFVSWSQVHAHDLQSNRMSRFYCAQMVPGRYHAIVRNRGKQTTTAKPTILVHAGRHHQIPADQRERSGIAELHDSGVEARLRSRMPAVINPAATATTKHMTEPKTGNIGSEKEPGCACRSNPFYSSARSSPGFLANLISPSFR